MGNERLRSAMAAAHLGVDGVAEAAGVDPKTVQRWLAGRTPHARHRWAIATLLSQDEAFLWPEAFANPAAHTGQVELVTLYAHRSQVPADLWWELFQSAVERIDLLAYAALFLPEQHLRLVELLSEKAAAGCGIRLLLGDPNGETVLRRGNEEQFGEGIASRVRVALRHYEPLRSRPGVAIHIHDTTLYNSIYVFDHTMLVNTHIYGSNAYSAPVLHLRRSGHGGLFDTYAESFEAVWALSRPWSPGEDHLRRETTRILQRPERTPA